MRRAFLVVVLAVACRQEAPVPVEAEPGFEGCALGCGAHVEFKEHDIVEQPGAKPGDLARCPVSNAVFEVKPSSPSVEVDGQRIYTCCPDCFERFQTDPAKFLARVEKQSAYHRHQLK